MMSYSEYYSLESSSDSSLCEKTFFDKYCSEEKMFKAKFNDKKFKTNVRLCINRLKLVEKKKTEMALKARKEIADYIKISKTGIFSDKVYPQKDIKLSFGNPSDFRAILYLFGTC